MTYEYEGFNEVTFLKEVIETEVEEVEEVEEDGVKKNKKVKRIVKINIGGKNYYEILCDEDVKEFYKLNLIDYLNKKIEITKKKVKKKGELTGKEYWEEIVETNDTWKAIRKAFLYRSKKTHPDKGGDPEAFNLINEAWYILSFNPSKEKYDDYYKRDIQDGDKVTDQFRNQVKKRLIELSERTDPTVGIGGAVAQGATSADIKKWRYLFPTDNSITNKLKSLNSKKIINKWANRIIYIYDRLRFLEIERLGQSSNKKLKEIKETELANFKEFKKDIYKLDSKDEIDKYVKEVEAKLLKIRQGSGTTNLEQAREINRNKLRSLSNWESVLGDENELYKEKWHFFNEINKVKSNNSKDWLYEDVIKDAQAFIVYKERVKSKLVDLKNIKGWNEVLLPSERKILENELKKLGEIEYIEVKKKNSHGEDVIRDKKTRMRFGPGQIGSDNLNKEINKVLQKAKDFIKDKEGSSKNSPPPKNNNTDQKLNSTIAEIKLFLKNNGFGKNTINGYGWLEDLKKLKGKDKAIDDFKEKFMIRCYRTLSKNIVLKKLNGELSQDVLKIDDLKEHFKKFNTQQSIKAEEQRLIDLINKHRNKSNQKTQEAKELIREALKNAKLENKTQEVLGKNWEDEFKLKTTDLEINQLTDNLIQKITDYVNKQKTSISETINEIKKDLKDSGLSEEILGKDWQNAFNGKSQDEINKEKVRLRKIIESKIKEVNKGKEQKEKLKKVLENTITSTFNQIKDKLKEGHPKLVIEEKDLPVALFAPHKNSKDKLNNLTKTEDVDKFRDEILKAIRQKKNEKFDQLVQATVNEINQMIGDDDVNDLNLGECADYKSIFSRSNSVEDLETKKNKIKKLITERKKTQDASNKQLKNATDSSTKNNPAGTKLTNFFKNPIVVTLLISSPLVATFFYFRSTFYKKSRKK